VFNGYDYSMVAIPAQFVSFLSLVEAKAVKCAAGAIFTSTGELYSTVDTAKAIFGAQAHYEKDLIVFANLGESKRLALRVNEIHGISRGRVKPLPLGTAEDRVAGILSVAGQLVIVLELEGFFAK
jgi:chemotaxis signal transduction protein